MGLLDDRVAVVTGGSSGIGRGIAVAFAEHGADTVVVADLRADPKGGGQPTHEVVEAETDASAAFVECDVSNVGDFEAVMDAAAAAGGVDVMVNNAGIWRPEEFLEVTEEAYHQLIDVNLTGAYFGAQAAARQMLEGDGGSIINVSSIAGLFGNGGWPTYAASKGGLTTLTYSLAHLFGDDGVRVNAIHPGAIETMIGSEAGSAEEEPAPERREIVEEQQAALRRSIPLGRQGTPADVAGAAVFLASDLSGYVTGESLVVDGGWTAWR